VCRVLATATATATATALQLFHVTTTTTTTTTATVAARLGDAWGGGATNGCSALPGRALGTRGVGSVRPRRHIAGVLAHQPCRASRQQLLQAPTLGVVPATNTQSTNNNNNNKEKRTERHSNINSTTHHTRAQV